MLTERVPVNRPPFCLESTAFRGQNGCMTDTTIGKAFLAELESEARATRACLENVPEGSADFQPHEKSMKMGYLAQLVAEIPLWVTAILTEGEIDFATFPHQQPSNAAELVAAFDQNMAGVREALSAADDSAFDATFSLKANGTPLSSDTKRNAIGSTINHLVHHRGQLTVYLKMRGAKIPSIYGPSADDRNFSPTFS